MREDVGHVAVLVDRVAEGVVGVFGDDLAVLVPVADHVAVVVVAGEVEVAVDADGDETAHAAGALERAGEVRAPEVREVGCVMAIGYSHVLPPHGVMSEILALYSTQSKKSWSWMEPKD